MPLATHTHSINRTTIPLPRALPLAARRKVESAIETHLAAVEALTAFLDEADGDPDLEPSLGSCGTMDAQYLDQREWAVSPFSDQPDLEHDPADPLYGGIDGDPDREPSLGSLNNPDRQIGWGSSGTDDLEHEGCA